MNSQIILTAVIAIPAFARILTQGGSSFSGTHIADNILQIGAATSVHVGKCIFGCVSIQATLSISAKGPLVRLKRLLIHS
jgi:hypothetical protein